MSIHEKSTVLIVDNINIYTHVYIYAYISNRYSLNINFMPYYLEHYFLFYTKLITAFVFKGGDVKLPQVHLKFSSVILTLIILIFRMNFFFL